MTARARAIPARRARLVDLDALEALENKAFDGDRLSRRSLRYYVATETAVLRVIKQGSALDHPAFKWNHLKTDKMIEFHKGRASDSPKTAYTFGSDALAAYSLLAFRKGSKIARLYSIAVDPAFEGYGFGRALLKICEKDARAHGCVTLRLEVRVDNRRAIKLYEKNGFERYDEIEDYYEDGATAICLKKALIR